jgi:hypothetical protein
MGRAMGGVWLRVVVYTLLAALIAATLYLVLYP